MNIWVDRFVCIPILLSIVDTFMGNFHNQYGKLGHTIINPNLYVFLLYQKVNISLNNAKMYCMIILSCHQKESPLCVRVEC